MIKSNAARSKLALPRETIRTLTARDLAPIAGGESGAGPSLNQGCNSGRGMCATQTVKTPTEECFSDII